MKPFKATTRTIERHVEAKRAVAETDRARAQEVAIRKVPNVESLEERVARRRKGKLAPWQRLRRTRPASPNSATFSGMTWRLHRRTGSHQGEERGLASTSVMLGGGQ